MDKNINSILCSIVSVFIMVCVGGIIIGVTIIESIVGGAISGSIIGFTYFLLNTYVKDN